MKCYLLIAMTFLVVMGNSSFADEWVEGPWHIETTDGKTITANAIQHLHSKTYAKDSTLLICMIAGQEAKATISDIHSIKVTKMLNEKWAEQWQITMTGGETAPFQWKNVVGANQFQAKTAFGEVTIEGKEVRSLRTGKAVAIGGYRLKIVTEEGKVMIFDDIELGTEFKVGTSTVVFSKQ